MCDRAMNTGREPVPRGPIDTGFHRRRIRAPAVAFQQVESYGESDDLHFCPMVHRTHRELTRDDVACIAGVYHAWRDRADAYKDLPGFCRSTPLHEVRRHGHVPTPGRYVSAEPQPGGGEPFEPKMRRLAPELHPPRADGPRLDVAIAENPNALGLGFQGRNHWYQAP